MAKRKIEEKATSSTKISKRITPIGTAVPKEGFPIDPSKIPTQQGDTNQIKFHKDDIPLGKIGPKGSLLKSKLNPKVELQVPKIEIKKGK